MQLNQSSSEATSLLIEAARKAWIEAIADFYHPPLPEPEIEHNPKASSYFYIDSGTWTVHLNTAGLPLNMASERAQSYIRSICHHEIQHYLLCPYDGVTNGMMFAAARSHVNDSTAMFVCNLFADMVVDSNLLQRYSELTRDRITMSINEAASRQKTHSDLWMLIVACYHFQWGFSIPVSVIINDDTLNAAKAIVKISQKYIDRESSWPRATARIAKLMAKWRPTQDEELTGCPANSTEDAGVVLVPLDVDAIMGSPIEVRNGDLAKRCLNPDEFASLDDEMERLAEEVQNRKGSLRDLEAVFILAGIGSPRKSWIRFWYRANVKSLLRIELKERSSAGLLPLSTDVWRLGDPVEDLDIIQSLQGFPVLVPNMSTRKWLQTTYEGQAIEHELPDILIVIDSSGSMTWKMGSRKVTGPYHTALLAAFSAVSIALEHGRRVSVINFSDAVTSCDWTRNRDEAERTLLSYQGGGTVAPVGKISEIVRSNDSKALVLILTDSEVANWDELLNVVTKVQRRGNKIFLFHIGSSSAKREKQAITSLTKAGASVIPINKESDLPGIVISEVRRYFSPSHS